MVHEICQLIWHIAIILAGLEALSILVDADIDRRCAEGNADDDAAESA